MRLTLKEYNKLISKKTSNQKSNIMRPKNAERSERHLGSSQTSHVKGCVVDSKEFDSDAERRFWLSHVYPKVSSGEVLSCVAHKTFEIIPETKHNGKKYCKRVYTPDFFIEYYNGSVEVVEIKGRVIKKLQRDYPLRRQLFIINHCIPNGWVFKEYYDDEV